LDLKVDEGAKVGAVKDILLHIRVLMKNILLRIHGRAGGCSKVVTNVLIVV
jgi:hypothetical protein